MTWKHVTYILLSVSIGFNLFQWERGFDLSEDCREKSAAIFALYKEKDSLLNQCKVFDLEREEMERSFVHDHIFNRFLIHLEVNCITSEDNREVLDIIELMCKGKKPKPSPLMPHAKEIYTKLQYYKKIKEMPSCAPDSPKYMMEDP